MTTAMKLVDVETVEAELADLLDLNDDHAILDVRQRGDEIHFTISR